MRVPVNNYKKLDKDQSRYKYEPIEDLSHRGHNGEPMRIPSQEARPSIQLPFDTPDDSYSEQDTVQRIPNVPLHPSHATVKRDSDEKKIKDPISEANERGGNLFDYVNWRGDIPMSVDPFNEVDSLLLSALVYAPFDGLVPEKGSVTLYALNIAFWNRYMVSDLIMTNPAFKYAPLLLKYISGSRRFGNVRACSFANKVDEKDQCQFAAMTFILEDGTCFTAFRGTDNSIIGWREDLNLSYMAMTRGQELAVEYMNKMFSGTSQFIRLGGHSKGGNLAVYAGMYCLPEIQERIREIYSNDGPGFNREITSSDSYKRIIPKIIKFMPEDSIVGILLDSGAKAQIVQSSSAGIYQHSPYTWIIRRNRILRAEKRSSLSEFVDKTVDDWIDMLDPESKRVFISVLFDAIESSGAKTISEFTEEPVRSYKAFYKSMRELPARERATLLLVLSKLAKSGKNQIVTGLTDYLSDLAHKS